MVCVESKMQQKEKIVSSASCHHAAEVSFAAHWLPCWLSNSLYGCDKHYDQE